MLDVALTTVSNDDDAVRPMNVLVLFKAAAAVWKASSALFRLPIPDSVVLVAVSALVIWVCLGLVDAFTNALTIDEVSMPEPMPLTVIPPLELTDVVDVVEVIDPLL